MSDDNDIVYFLMPDGSKVSNDPRFGLEEALQKQADATVYSGDAGIPTHLQDAQSSVIKMATPQSGQPDVGPNATFADPMDAISPTGTGLNVQTEDVKLAKEAGGSPTNTSVKDSEPIDSNEAVAAARKAKEEADEALSKALAKLADADEEPGDPEVPYSEWTAKQLKAEVARRNVDRDEENQLSTKGLTKKSEVASLLEEDDKSNPADPDNS